MPSAYILRSLLNPSDPCHPLIASSSIPSPSQGKTTLHLQDYNRPVLSLVTLPNLLLAALPFLPAEAFHQPDEAADVEALLPDLDKAGEVAVTEALKGAFKGLLEERGVQLRFTFGHWAGLAKELAGATGSIGSGDGEGRYGLVMSAETIYAEDSANDLIAVLRGASQCGERTGVPGAAGRRKEEVALEDSLGDLSMMDAWANAPLREGESVVLIAAKVRSP
jgi:protein-histidine N-methyltransferase